MGTKPPLLVDEEEPHVERLEDGSYSVGRRIPIGTVNEDLSSDFESEDFDTVGVSSLAGWDALPRLATSCA